MFPAINILGIVKDHINSLGTFSRLSDMEQGTSEWRLSCLILFIGLPAVAGVLSFSYISKDLISLAVNTSSIFSALLLNLMVLLYQMKQKSFENEDEKKRKARLSVIRYTFTNAAFSVILSVIILVTAIVASFFSTPDTSIANRVFTGVIVFFSTMLVTTLFVIIKRMMKLFDIN